MKDHRITVMFAVNNLGGGGAEQQLLELVRGIDKTRFKPLVVPLYSGYSLESEVRQIPGAELIPINRKGKYDYSVLIKMFSLLRQHKVDIVQPFLTPATFFSLLPAIINHTPVRIVTERSGVWLYTNLGHKVYQKIEDFLTRFTDWSIPNSEAGRMLLIKRGINPDRIKVIYNGINFERLNADQSKVDQIRHQIGLPVNGMVVGITASLSLAKDHATFLRMAKIVHQAIPETRFAILGDGPLRQNLENLTRELGVESYVTFFGRQQDVGSYVSAFDVFCLCSVDHEGCSNATLEAMALGKPAVITDVGGNRELVDDGKTAIMVPVQNPEALADGILTCLKQPNRSKDMGLRAREMVLTRFSLNHMVHEYEQLYEQAIQIKRIK
jgi:glycosyltransferase involved in cell wall biosynthesis